MRSYPTAKAAFFGSTPRRRRFRAMAMPPSGSGAKVPSGTKHGIVTLKLQNTLEADMRVVVIGLVVGAALGLVTGVTTIKLLPPGPQVTWGVVQSQTTSSNPVSWDI
jgi:hypothetical protein